MNGHDEMSTFCFVEAYDESTDDPVVANAFNYVSKGRGRVENMYKAMSLSPKVIKPIHDLYLALLHDEDSPLEYWMAELLSVQVAILNQCDYALAHHSTNLHNVLNNPAYSTQLITALEKDNWAEELSDEKLIGLLDYGKKLCLTPHQVDESDINQLRVSGFSDKEIVFVAQINAAFAYWTRILNALGVEIAGESLGLEQLSS